MPDHERKHKGPSFLIYYMMSQPGGPDSRTYYELILQSQGGEIHCTDLEGHDSYNILSGNFRLICPIGVEESILWGGANRAHDKPLPYLVNEQGERIEDIVAIAKSIEELQNAYFYGSRSVLLGLRLVELDFNYKSLVIPDPDIELLVPV